MFVDVYLLKQGDWYQGFLNPRCWFLDPNNLNRVWSFFEDTPFITKSGINLKDEFNARIVIDLSQGNRGPDALLSEQLIKVVCHEGDHEVWTRIYRISGYKFTRLDRSQLELMLFYEPFYNYFSQLEFDGFYQRTTISDLTYKTDNSGHISWINPYSLKQQENINLNLTNYSIAKMDEFADVSLYFLNTNAVLNKDTVNYALEDIYKPDLPTLNDNPFGGPIPNLVYDNNLEHINVVSDGVFWVTLFDQNLGFVFSDMTPFESFNGDFYAHKISQAAILGHVRSVPVPWAIRYQQSFLNRKHWQPFLNKRGDQRIDTSVANYLDYIHQKRQPLPEPQPLTKKDLPEDLSTAIITIRNDYDKWCRGFQSEKDYYHFCTSGTNQKFTLDFSKEFRGWDPKIIYQYTDIDYISPWGSSRLNPLTSIQQNYQIKITPIYIPTWVDCLTSLVVDKNFFCDTDTIYYNHKKVFNYTSTNKYQDYFATNILTLPLEKFQRSWSAAFSVLGSLVSGATSLAGSVASGNVSGALSAASGTVGRVGNAIMDRVQFQNSLEQKKAFRNVESQSSGVFDYFQQIAVEKVARKVNFEDNLDDTTSQYSYLQLRTPPIFLKQQLQKYFKWFGWQVNQFYYFKLLDRGEFYQNYPLQLRTFEYFEITNISWPQQNTIPRVYKDYFEKVFKSGIYIIQNPSIQLYDPDIQTPYRYYQQPGITISS